MKGFTLVEILVTLMIVALTGFIILPSFVERAERGKGFFNELNQAVREIAPLSENQTLCVDFSNGTVTISKTLIKSPYRIKYLLSPSMLYSSEFSKRKCISFKGKPTVVSIIFQKNEKDYIGYTVLTSTGEAVKQNLDEAEMETLKDKILKGRVLEWFKRH